MQHDFSAALRAGFLPLLPEMILGIFACVLFLGGTFRHSRRLWNSVALVGLGLSLAAVILLQARPDLLQRQLTLVNENIYGVPFLFDGLATVTRYLAIGGGLILVLVSWRELPARQTSDHHACLLIIVAGTALVGAANDLVSLFIVLELVSIPTYILLYLPRHDEPAQEAALKYFLLSILSSGLLLFGFSYLYGLAGTTNISGILRVFQGHHAELSLVGGDDAPVRGGAELRAAAGMVNIALVLVVAALGFRITAVPFHFYAPDVYQGTSISSAAFLAYIPKVAGFAALLRVLGFIVPPALVAIVRQAENLEPGQRLGVLSPGMILSEQVPILLWFLAVVTMTLGNFLGLLQDNLRRLFAYSSVAQAGYMLIALASAPYLVDNGNTNGVAALLYYLVAYGAMTIGAFAVFGMLNTSERPVETIDDLAGLGQSHPGTALMLVVLLFSLIGIPLTAGFNGKLLIFMGAINVSESLSGLYSILALIGLLNAGIGAWYYLRIIAAMYLRPAVRPVTTPGTTQGRLALVVCVVLTLGLSVPPASRWLLDASRQAMPTLAAPPADQARAR